MTNQLTDSFGRNLSYLRVSLTDRCNFRCIYCMPPEGIPLTPRNEILRIEEFERLIRIFISLGVKKVRLTGGEPMLRSKAISLISKISSIPGLSTVALTTNGSLIGDKARELKKAGLSSLNISIDSLNRERFLRITRTDQLDNVLEGLVKALDAGLRVKVNTVAMNDLSQDEVTKFCKLAEDHPIEVRFIEFMPLCGTGWNKDKGLNMVTLEGWIRNRFELIPIASRMQVAKSYKIKGAKGSVGFISSLSHPFCSSCNRLRLTSKGTMQLCLFSDRAVDLKSPLRQWAGDDDIAKIIKQAIRSKPKGHEEITVNTNEKDLPKIRTIGG